MKKYSDIFPSHLGYKTPDELRDMENKIRKLDEDIENLALDIQLKNKDLIKLIREKSNLEVILILSLQSLHRMLGL